MRRIVPPSELILNADGSVYHLHLHPHEIADTIITVGDPERVAQVSRYFDDIEFKGTKREFVTHTGRIGKNRLTVLSSGIGPDNIDIVLNELDILANMDLSTRLPAPIRKSLRIIRMGTSGALQADLGVDTMIVSQAAVGIDNLLHFYQYLEEPESRMFQEALSKHCQFPLAVQPYYFQSNADLVACFGSEFVRGTTLTAPGFYGPQGRQVHAPAKMPDLLDRVSTFQWNTQRITNIEMESAAIFGLSSVLGHKAVSVNAILANRASGIFSKDPHAAIERLIERALEVVITFPE